jgi:hypothetical protein
MSKPRKAPPGSALRTINLEKGMPLVHEALTQLERELSLARQQRYSIVKLIHGYGSRGVGGDIRVAVQKRLRELEEQGSIRACIFGENWSSSDSQTWALVKLHPALKTDHDLGKRNLGITIVLL